MRRLPNAHAQYISRASPSFAIDSVTRAMSSSDTPSNEDGNRKEGSSNEETVTDNSSNPATESEAKQTAKEQTRKKPAVSFRAMAKKVQRNRALTRCLAQNAKRHLKMYTAAVDGKEPEIFTFNVQSYFPEWQSCSGLSERVKIILTKPGWSRNEEELEIIRRFVLKLSCFSRYSVYVRQELAHVLFYEVFESRRVIIRQGDIGFNFYFIISGSVLVEVQETDPISGVVRSNIVGVLGPGATFGDLALLNGDSRRATIVCKEDCEFLKVDKDDFKRILMESCRENGVHSNSILSQHPLFKCWPQHQLKLAVEGSQFVEFTSNSVIIKDLSELSENVFIITKGKCQVVQKVTLLESENGTLKLPREEEEEPTLPPLNPTHGNSVVAAAPQRPPRATMKKCQKWWLLRTLYPGDYFGLGEGPTNSSVICADIAECLLVNTIVLAKKSQGRYLETVQAEAKLLYPTLEEAFKSYADGNLWDQYKKKILHEVVTDLKRNRKSYE